MSPTKLRPPSRGGAQLIGFCFLAGKSLRYPTPLIVVPGHVGALAVGEAAVVQVESTGIAARMVSFATSVSPSFSTRGVGDPGNRSRPIWWSKGLPHRCAVLVVVQKLSPGADARRRLGRQGEVELFEQQSVISLRVSVAA
jgi:hypothetical protein